MIMHVREDSSGKPYCAKSTCRTRSEPSAGGAGRVGILRARAALERRKFIVRFGRRRMAAAWLVALIKLFRHDSEKGADL